MVFELVPPLLVGIFAVVSLLAMFIHKLSGSHQKVPLTFIVLVSFCLWLSDKPWSEPFPGALTFIVATSTFLQALLAGLAYWLRNAQTR